MANPFSSFENVPMPIASSGGGSSSASTMSAGSSQVLNAIRAGGRFNASYAEVEADQGLAQQISDQCQRGYCADSWRAAENTRGQRAIYEAAACFNACLFLYAPLDTPGLDEWRVVAIENANLAMQMGSTSATVRVIPSELSSPSSGTVPPTQTDENFNPGAVEAN